jgi:hypothetical protein
MNTASIPATATDGVSTDPALVALVLLVLLVLLLLLAVAVREAEGSVLATPPSIVIPGSLTVALAANAV